MSTTTAAPNQSVLPHVILDADGTLTTDGVIVTDGNMTTEAMRAALGPTTFHPELLVILDGWQMWGDGDAATWSSLPYNRVGSALRCMATGERRELFGRIVFVAVDEDGRFVAYSGEQLRELGQLVRSLDQVCEALHTH